MADIVMTGCAKGSSWYAVQAQPGRERLAFEHLDRQGFRAFLPAVKRPRRIGTKHVMATSALFPGYLFVSFNPDRDRWRSINGTVGVMRLVSFGEHPTALPRGFVETLASAGSDPGGPLECQLTQGVPVRIMGGVFDDITGTLLAKKPGERVVVLLDILSGRRRVTLPRRQVMQA
ncbi:transcription termination/antitermination NusG family protein [Aurantiacibacter rhizosphaerae]|uniref:Transcriptional activator RfaH n=1 Tax=Aurantiacibacter rhizosphaerae TaxID=2691582 RepID=A0A844XB70_9SPHN|nr:transcription termination/antitermination NusG family protein [Aurantiacibacter rhizosphaerae]MWV26962.1 transcriptional activator RfaH [Aurantiacibacter rhizosphaerae]